MLSGRSTRLDIGTALLQSETFRIASALKTIQHETEINGLLFDTGYVHFSMRSQIYGH